jgi:hypothetical protein
MHGYALKRQFDASWPGFVEVNSIYALKNVCASRGVANLNNGRRIVAKISGCETGERRSKLGKGAKNRLAVLDSRADEEIDIFCGSRLRVEPHRPSSDDQVLNPVCVERE